MKLTQKSAKHYRFPGIRHNSLAAPLDAKNKNGFFNRTPLRLGKKTKALLAFGIIIVFLTSIFAFLPKQSSGDPLNTNPQSSDDPTNGTSPSPSNPDNQQGGHNILSDLGKAVSHAIDTALSTQNPGTIEGAKAANSDMWKAVAKNAWQYFQPGVGVNKDTGIPYAGLDYPYITDWDLGSYIEAVMDAQKIGLINENGTWGSSMRMEKIVSFLETRELNNSTSNNCPYWNYQAADGKHWQSSSVTEIGINVIDTGRLFVALNNLENFNASLAPRIDRLVHDDYGNRTDYTSVLSDVYADSQSSTSIYAYLSVSGYASFFSNYFPPLANATAAILNNMQKAGNVTMGTLQMPDESTITVTLPEASITCDPLLLSVFETKHNSYLSALSYDVYLAHEAKYDSDPTQTYAAYSEGNSGMGLYIWESVVSPNGDKWTITGSYFDMAPVIYNKVSISFLALYNTTYAYDMSVYLEKNLPDPSVKGYCDGVDANGRLVLTVGCNTNSLILSAARYALQS